MATLPDARNPAQYGFLDADAPPTVNPSLWRQAQLNAINGLFKVADSNSGRSRMRWSAAP